MWERELQMYRDETDNLLGQWSRTPVCMYHYIYLKVTFDMTAQSNIDGQSTP